jgi:GTP-binding protein EngB required for normal cell division
MELLKLHSLLTVPRRTPSIKDLNAATFFFQHLPVTSIKHASNDFSKGFQPKFGGYPEIVIAGASSVGKSSLLNALLNKKGGNKVALVGARPGTTKSINFHNVGDRLMLLDFMGYGVNSRREWGEKIESYFQNRIEYEKF